MRKSSQIRDNTQASGTGSGLPGGSLLGRLAATIVGIGVFGVAIFLGAIFLAVVVGLVLIAGLVVSLRVWWLKRQMQRYAEAHGDLEAEYVEVHEAATPLDRPLIDDSVIDERNPR